MRVRLLGTRGSLYSPRPGTSRYGANTSCVEVRPSDGSIVVLDAGSGIRQLAEPGPGCDRIDVLLTHLHMDHIVGLGFFRALYQPGLEVHLWGPPSAVEGLHARLTRYLSPPLFPVRLRDLPCRLILHEVTRSGFDLPGLSVQADLVCHPGPTLGYRLEENGVALSYLPDHEPALGVRRFPAEPDWTSGFSLLAGADLAIHDAQYADDEYPGHEGWGHSALGHTLALAEAAGVAHLVGFHHDPDHDDAMIDELYEKAAGRPWSFRLTPATEGAVFHLGGSAGLLHHLSAVEDADAAAGQ